MPSRAPRRARAPLVAPVRLRLVMLVAPAAVRIRRSRAVSLRMSPTVMARTPRARIAPAVVDQLRSGARDSLLVVASTYRPMLSAAMSKCHGWRKNPVCFVVKSPTLFPTFNAALKSSMLQGTQLFLRNIVLEANADVRSFYDSDQTFADANLAAFYGVQAPASGFAQFKLPASSGRAGILGQAGLIAAQSQADRTSPTRRGIFILESLLCITPPTPPQGVNTMLAVDKTLTTREILEAHRKDPTCANCHALFDPLGIAMEHFDPIGRYREQENGLPIDATGSVGGMSFDGVAQLGGVLRQDPRALSCLLSNFYRNANGRAEDDKDRDQIDSMGKSLAARNYVWKSFLTDFVASDAFRSAPALPVTTGSP